MACDNINSPFNVRIVIPESTSGVANPVEVRGESPIQVRKQLEGDKEVYVVSTVSGLGILYTTRSTDGITEGLGNPISDNDKPAPSIPYSATTATTGNVVWSADSSNAVYISIRTSTALNWGTPVRLQGNNGQQGKVGNYIKFIYKWNSTLPATPTTGVLPTGWFDTPPSQVTGQVLWVSMAEVSAATSSLASQLVGTWSTPIQLSGNKGDKGNDSTVEGPRGPKGTDGDPLLTNGFNQNSLQNNQVVTINQVIGANQVLYSPWIQVDNAMTIARHVITKYRISGFNNSTLGSILLATLEFSSINPPIAGNIAYDCGISWDDREEFQAKIQGNAVGATLSGFSVNRVPANEILFVRVKLTNQGGGTLDLNNFSCYSFLL